MHGQDVAVVGGDLVHLTLEPHCLDYFRSIAWVWRLLQGSSCQGGDLLAQELGDPWQDADRVLNNGRGADASSHLVQRSSRWSLHVGEAALPTYMQALDCRGFTTASAQQSAIYSAVTRVWNRSRVNNRQQWRELEPSRAWLTTIYSAVGRRTGIGRVESWVERAGGE